MRSRMFAAVVAMPLVLGGCWDSGVKKEYVDAMGTKLTNELGGKIDEKFSELGGKIETYQADVAKLRQEVPDMVAKAMTAYMVAHGKPNGKTGGKPDELLVAQANSLVQEMGKTISDSGLTLEQRVVKLEQLTERLVPLVQRCAKWCPAQKQTAERLQKNLKARHYAAPQPHQPPPREYEYTDPRYADWYNNVYLPRRHAAQQGVAQASMQPAVQQGIAVGHVTHVVPASAGPSFGLSDVAHIVNSGANLAAALRPPAQMRIHVNNQVQAFGGAGGAGGSVGNVTATGHAAAAAAAVGVSTAVTPTSGAAANQGATSGAASGR